MRQFKAVDFIRQMTDEGHEYFNCIMGNGLEIQVDPQNWGWRVSIHDMEGATLVKNNYPFLVNLSGRTDFHRSHSTILESTATMYAILLKKMGQTY